MMDLEVEDVIDEAIDVKTFLFDEELSRIPGQFGMFWLAGTGQKPMSFSYANGITVKKVGPFTKALFEIKKGDTLAMAGPYGQGFHLEGEKVLIIGGGYGIAPLRFLAEKCYREDINTTILLGFKTRHDMFFEDTFKKFGNVLIATEDGSYEEKGLVTKLLENLGKDFDCGYCCGPEKMMFEVKKLLGREIPLQFSLERYMKCGMGLCGSCEIDGMLVCKDGPVMHSDEIGPSFGKVQRDRTGKLVKL
ncbi:MAG: dihydroorotate dehydrogenase electron transfer subunit [Candidatus Methanofastidiosia archaeon]